jgi:hypothetical protein
MDEAGEGLISKRGLGGRLQITFIPSKELSHGPTIQEEFQDRPRHPDQREQERR